MSFEDELKEFKEKFTENPEFLDRVSTINLNPERLSPDKHSLEVIKFIKDVIGDDLGVPYVLSFNDEQTRESIKMDLHGLSTLLVDDIRIQCDDKNNSPDVVDNMDLVIGVGVFKDDGYLYNQTLSFKKMVDEYPALSKERDRQMGIYK